MKPRYEFIAQYAAPEFVLKKIEGGDTEEGFSANEVIYCIELFVRAKAITEAQAAEMYAVIMRGNDAEI